MDLPILRARGGCLQAVLALILAMFAAVAAAAERSHEEAIALARAGKTAEALALLQERHKAAPDDPRIVWDYLTVLTWAGKDAEALDLLSQTSAAPLPPYALEAAAKAARNLRRLDTALALYQEGADRFPDHPALAAGLVLTEVDLGQISAAVTSGRLLTKRFPDSPEPILAAAYAEEASGDYFAALRLYDRILARHPEQTEARRRQILAVDALGAPSLAVDLAKGDPSLLGSDEWGRLLSNRAAQAIRWGDLPAEEAAPFADADRALELLEGLLLDEESAVTRPYLLRLRTDRLVALRNRGRMREAALEYEQLCSAGVRLPFYALAAAADAHLALGQPEQARALYSEALRLKPGDFDLRLSLFYALADLGEYATALDFIEQMAREEPVWLAAPAGHERRPNPRKAEAEMAAALGLAWTGDLPAAQERFALMLRQAPGNHDLYRELGNVYATRGWPRRAIETYRRGLALAPGHSGLRVGFAQALLTLDEGDKAAPVITELVAQSPENREVQRLRRDNELRGKRELRSEVRGADSSGPEYGSRELFLDNILYSQVFAERFRAFASVFYAEADFPEGDEEFRRYGGGVEYRAGGLIASGELTYNADGGRDPGGNVNVALQLNDHWSLGGRIEIFSRDTPLRALRHDIDADSASLGFAYRWSERQRVAANIQVMDFSDGNFRRTLFSSFRRRLLTRPTLQVDGDVEIYASKNNREEAPYFNPEHDFHTALSVDGTWRQMHRPSLSFHHRLATSGGRYWQEGFDPGWTVSALYEHLWQFGDLLEVAYGVGRSRHVYDGDPDYATTYHLRILGRF